MKIQISLSRFLTESEVRAHAQQFELHGVHYDQVKGKGAIPFNQEIGYKGISVLMKPSTFLDLCYPIKIGSAEATNFEFIKNWIKEKNPIGSPWLRVELNDDSSRLTEGAYVSGHEGRNRALAIKELFGDVDMMVHITFPGYNNRNITDEVREKLRSGLKSQTGRLIVGPLFK